jgi:hypothetical protein
MAESQSGEGTAIVTRELRTCPAVKALLDVRDSISAQRDPAREYRVETRRTARKTPLSGAGCVA